MSSSTRPQLRVAVIVGSTREGRFAPVVTQWLKGHLAQRGDMTTDVVDLTETPLPTVLPAFGEPPAPGTEEALALVSPRLAAADAFVFVTPEYNHSFPASLKNAIDWHNQQWHAKPVAFVSYGGLSGGLRAVEQLRVVMAELNATTIRNTVSFHNAYGQFAEDGTVDDAQVDAAAKALLDQLAWWAHALRDARAATPYTA
ncbi:MULTISPECIES: NADPH-dependent FMN reductase [unclassified Streptomyces]|uniref:NADPH-dependent FMN reductase n=1 Tax=unclassified Streptomyces TaxID=2593676 RepID=UPI002556D285|nr:MULTISPECIES: NAD(P)H-dependent oxidoreductase [unclassified Streptomyces]WRZ64937.1 NAD(P)H-dependent oxidoreductase [Streptomyces sp. NBC_01257]WSU58936.1 NAD(P)H-dependent oxidoreductase [Streptomyces sp. NBC_01104]